MNEEEKVRQQRDVNKCFSEILEMFLKYLLENSELN